MAQAPVRNQVTARKVYKCDGCGEFIRKGQTYTKGQARYGYGESETLRYCQRCM